jgi:hypothetical protein
MCGRYRLTKRRMLEIQDYYVTYAGVASAPTTIVIAMAMSELEIVSMQRLCIRQAGVSNAPEFSNATIMTLASED